MTCFDQCERIEQLLKAKLLEHSTQGKTYQNSTSLNIRDTSYYSDKFARAHLSVVDARESKNLFLLHCTIVPNEHDPSPIYGFDIISGPKKVSGAFHDFSPIGPSQLLQQFESDSSELTWNKRRPLPEWAKSIFSENIVAIGAVGPDELVSFIEFGLHTLNCYMSSVGTLSDVSYKDKQTHYSSQQRLNESTLRTLVALGMTDTEAKEFVFENLFPL